MAGIISQMSANKKRARQKNHTHIPSDKCVYTLQAFDPCFNPLLHNKYMKGIHLTSIDNKLKIQKRDYEIEVCIQVTRFLPSEAKVHNLSEMNRTLKLQKTKRNGSRSESHKKNTLSKLKTLKSCDFI